MRAQIALKFENLTESDRALKDITLAVCEREGKKIRDLPLRGRKPETVRLKPKLREYNNPANEIEIAGLLLRGNDFSPTYFFVDEEMIADIQQPTLTNDKHFLRLTLYAVGQDPYIIDIEVDWTEPGAWIKSATPLTN